MKVAYIFKSIQNIGGMERILTAKMNYLAENYNYDVTIITLEQKNKPFSFPIIDSIKHIDLNINIPSISYYTTYKWIYHYCINRNKFSKKLKTVLNEIQADIIICTTYSFMELDIIFSSYQPSYYILESHVKKSTEETKYRLQNKKSLSLISKIWDKYIYYNIKKKCSMVVSLTNKDASEWKSIKKTVVIPNMYTQTTPPLQNENSKTIISAGRLIYQKGYDMLIQAWNIVHIKHPDWKLLIYGDGPDFQKLKSMIQEYKIESSLHILPFTHSIYEEYCKSSFYVMSSRYEGFAMVLIEAMACGLPCIAFDCPHGPSEIIKNNKNGLLIESGNISKLATGINYLIEHSHERSQYSKQAFLTSQKYKPEIIMKQWNNLFQSIISQR